MKKYSRDMKGNSTLAERGCLQGDREYQKTRTPSFSPVQALLQLLIFCRVLYPAPVRAPDCDFQRRRKSFAQAPLMQPGLSIVLTFLFQVYYFLAILHAVPHILETGVGYTSFGRNTTINDIRAIAFNSRYAFMLTKSVVIFIVFRWETERVLDLASRVSSEFAVCSRRTQKYIWIYLAVLVSGVVNLYFVWEVLDWCSWDADFSTIWYQKLYVKLLDVKLDLWIVLTFWWTFGSPLNLLMNLAMVFYASVVLTLYCRWRRINATVEDQLINHRLHDLVEEWDRLSVIAEEIDDVLSIVVFVSWVSDIACAVAYLGSVVVYGGGAQGELVYTLLGLLVHAVWNPGCYVVPCFLFDEEIAKTRRIVVHAISAVAGFEPLSQEEKFHLLEANLLLQKVSYRPMAFTAWKFFYVTRNVILTIATILVSYALVIAQMLGQR